MIKGEDINTYENYNKIYIPDGYINQNYKYNFSGDYIIIRTNQNCTTNYNTTYCDCYQYRIDTNTLSQVYECNYTNTSNQSLAYTQLSDDLNDSMYLRERYVEDKSVLLVMIIVGILFATLLVKRGAYR